MTELQAWSAAIALSVVAVGAQVILAWLAKRYRNEARALHAEAERMNDTVVRLNIEAAEAFRYASHALEQARTFNREAMVAIGRAVEDDPLDRRH